MTNEPPDIELITGGTDSAQLHAVKMIFVRGKGQH